MSEKNFKFLNHHDKSDLKKSSRDLIRLCGGIEAISEDTGIGKTSIGNIHNHNHETFMPLDMILNLERDAGMPIVTKALARKQGYVLINTRSDFSHSEAGVLLARLGKETSEVFGVMSEAISSGWMLPEKAKQSLSEVQDMIREANELASYLTKIIEGEKP